MNSNGEMGTSMVGDGLKSSQPSNLPFVSLLYLTQHKLSASASMSSRASRTLYVGNLPGDIREREVEDLFYKYGPIAEIDLKIPPRPPGYAFVEFYEARDAEDAIRGRDGYDFDGHRLRVELAHGGRGRPSDTDRRRPKYSGGGGDVGGRVGGVSRHSDYRVLVTGLPSSASWQDLKDHMRRAGDVCFSQVFKDGRGTTGVVDYTNYEDMKYAIRKLDDSEFRNAFTRSYIRVEEYGSKRSLSRSRSRSRSYSRSGSRSLSRSRSQSKSPKAKTSRRPKSRSRSRSVSSRSRSPRSLSRSRSRSRSPLPSPPRSKHVSRSPKKRSRSHSKSRSLSRSPLPSSRSKRRRSKSRSLSRSPLPSSPRRNHVSKSPKKQTYSRSKSRSLSRSRSPAAKSDRSGSVRRGLD